MLENSPPRLHRMSWTWSHRFLHPKIEGRENHTMPLSLWHDSCHSKKCVSTTVCLEKINTSLACWETACPHSKEGARPGLIDFQGLRQLRGQVTVCTAETGSIKCSMFSAKRVEGRMQSVQCREMMVELKGHIVRRRVQRVREQRDISIHENCRAQSEDSRGQRVTIHNNDKVYEVEDNGSLQNVGDG